MSQPWQIRLLGAEAEAPSLARAAARWLLALLGWRASLPCASCGAPVTAGTSRCPECGADAGALELECPGCDGDGVVRYAIGASPYEEEDGTSTCPTCDGTGSVDAPWREEREAGLRAAEGRT